MTPYYQDSTLTVLNADVRDGLATLAAQSVQCVVTSPPYWNLRDYNTGSWDGGDAGCGLEPDERQQAEIDAQLDRALGRARP